MKKMGIIITSIALLVIGSYLFLQNYPEFGKTLNKKQKEQFASLQNFKKGKFINSEEIKMDISLSNIFKMIKGMTQADPLASPKQKPIVKKICADEINQMNNQLVWLGHSSFLIAIENSKILIDPIFSKQTGPISFLGRKKFSSEMPFSIEDLDEIDLVLISHDHYDHLDYESIQKLASKTKRFIVPLGVENHLLSWGVDAEKIVSLNWWEEQQYEHLNIALTPTRHMSGRKFTSQSTTLWGSFVIKGKQNSIFFSGDGGYGKHFQKIGEKYGPFDMALVECGQYNELWENVHMYPEQSVQAGIDVHAKQLLPIHWGAYQLAMHNWLEPVERFIKDAKRKNIPTQVPQIGEVVDWKQIATQKEYWWKK